VSVLGCIVVAAFISLAVLRIGDVLIVMSRSQRLSLKLSLSATKTS
jgi:hypothetical protein